MAMLKIVKFPDPFLKRKCKPVDKMDARIPKLIEDMAETMYASSGIGLAAIQVGVDQRIIVFDTTEENKERSFLELINPEIIKMEGSCVSEEEGCLSVPDFKSNVKRAKSIVVQGLDRNGKKKTLSYNDLRAIVIQHEVDHLNGILFIDRISSLKRELYKRSIKKQIKNS
ncbi:MAG: peptide deformylase [Desulfobacterales bacterium]|nr:peptide deformylase [Desulfobacterales bacterium]